MRAAKGADKALIADVARLRCLRGEARRTGKKSLAIEVTLSRATTLTDEEIDKVSAASWRRSARRPAASFETSASPALQSCRTPAV